MPEDILQSLSGSKDQLAQASETAKGVASGALSTAEAFKIPDQVAAAQQALEGLPAGPNFDAAKDAMGNATKAAVALKDELAQKLPEPVSQGKDALTGLGQEVKASGGGFSFSALAARFAASSNRSVCFSSTDDFSSMACLPCEADCRRISN